MWTWVTSLKRSKQGQYMYQGQNPFCCQFFVNVSVRIGQCNLWQYWCLKTKFAKILIIYFPTLSLAYLFLNIKLVFLPAFKHVWKIREAQLDVFRIPSKKRPNFVKSSGCKSLLGTDFFELKDYITRLSILNFLGFRKTCKVLRADIYLSGPDSILWRTFWATQGSPTLQPIF